MYLNTYFRILLQRQQRLKNLKSSYSRSACWNRLANIRTLWRCWAAVPVDSHTVWSWNMCRAVICSITCVPCVFSTNRRASHSCSLSTRTLMYHRAKIHKSKYTFRTLFLFFTLIILDTVITFFFCIEFSFTIWGEWRKLEITKAINENES